MKRGLSEAQMWLVDYLIEKLPPIWSVVSEYPFCEGRRWRFDVAAFILERKLAFEIEGGVHIQGRHSRGVGMENDMEKYNTAAALGWKVFRFTPEQILKGQAKAFIERYL